MSLPQSSLTDPRVETDIPAARTVRVMLVDDSLVVRSILERIVDGTPGLTVCASVASAHDALAFLATEPVDVVVLDIEMPGMNGIDALPHILRSAVNARVLILSSNCVEGGPAAIDALSLGASDTLAKPGRGSFSGRFAEILNERIMTLGHQRDFPAPIPVGERPAPARSAALTIDTDQPIECIAIAARIWSMLFSVVQNTTRGRSSRPKSRSLKAPRNSMPLITGMFQSSRITSGRLARQKRSAS